MDKRFARDKSISSDSWFNYSEYSPPGTKIPSRLVNKDAVRLYRSELDDQAHALAKKSVGTANKEKLSAKGDEILMRMLAEVPFRKPETLEEYALFYLTYDGPRQRARAIADGDKMLGDITFSLTGLMAGPLGGMTTPVRTGLMLAVDKGLQEAGVPGLVRFPLFVAALKVPGRGGLAGGASQGGRNAASRLPYLQGMGRADAHLAIRNQGFNYHATTKGGYVRYRHADGSEIWLRPNGEVMRYGPPIQGREGHPRLDRFGKPADHPQDEFIPPLPPKEN